MQALSVGLVSTDGVGKVLDGVDSYTTSLVQNTELPDGAPCSFIKVGRELQPLGAAFFHVSSDAQ